MTRFFSHMSGHATGLRRDFGQGCRGSLREDFFSHGFFFMGT